MDDNLIVKLASALRGVSKAYDDNEAAYLKITYEGGEDEEPTIDLWVGESAGERIQNERDGSS